MAITKPTPPNWQTVALAIVAAGLQLALTALAVWQASNAAITSRETHAAVNSQLSEYKKLMESAATAAATLAEKRAQAGREQAAEKALDAAADARLPNKM